MANKRIVEQVNTFNYLGATINSARELVKEVLNQTNKASANGGYLRGPLFKNKYLNIECKVKIYKTCIRPLITCATETRFNNSKTLQMMESTEMMFFRTIIGRTLQNQIPSATIRDEWNITDIRTWTRSRFLN